MNKQSDFTYYSVRLSAARSFAERAATPKVRAIHLEMADHYQRLANSAARAICEQPTGSDTTAQAPVQVVLVESGNLHQLNRI